MMVFLLSALVMGAAGSLHCVGMCGPLALALPLKENQWAKFAGTLLYNFGRAITYTILGIAFGLLGSSFKLFGMQQVLSIAMGVLIIIFLLLARLFVFKRADHFIQKWFLALRQKLGYFFKQKNYSSVFTIGLLNGLLPCGLVYMAAAAAITSASVWNSALFMLFFGLGTLPLMWSISFFGSYFSINARVKLRKAYPYLMTLMACILIVRGLGLGIPYLSPSMVSDVHNIPTQCHPVK